MQKFKSLSDAIALAEFAHRNQTDKAGLPYIEHPRRVMQKVQAQGALPFVQQAAILHDVTEDTAFTPQMLLDLGFSEAAVNVIKLLDRNESEADFHRINAGRDLSSDGKFYAALGPQAKDDHYYRLIRADEPARLVKLADIEDNLSPWRLSYLSEETQIRLKKKYAHARGILEGTL